MGINNDTPTSFTFEVSRENVRDLTYINKFGKNNNLDIANAEDVWNGGGTYIFPTSASTLTVVSDSANDAAAGTGGRTMLIQGLDSNFDELEETITFNGTTNVITIGSFIRVNRVTVLTAGATGSNEGTITVNSGSLLLAQIDPLEGRGAAAIFTVPNGKVGYFVQVEATLTARQGATGTKEGDLVFLVRPENGAFVSVGDLGLSSRTGVVVFDRSYASKFEGKTDVKARFQSFDNNAKVNVSFTVVLEDVT